MVNTNVLFSKSKAFCLHSPASWFGVFKNLERNITRTANPKQPARYSMPYNVTLSDEIVCFSKIVGALGVLGQQPVGGTWLLLLCFLHLLPKWLYLKPQGGLPHTPLPFWFSPIFHCGGISKWLAVALQQWQIGELQINLVTKTALFFVTLYTTLICFQLWKVFIF